ncbi:hypothetical protein OUZ56_002319 [Daphnia magna]|uniref:Uncharacterized protein n=1 Tax=Daphnia magna TaxID=35525 RepID=A0ABR0A5A9_9CRUS|nr:hypothetical protein OUZ56_002319 [Daphnia magna]
MTRKVDQWSGFRFKVSPSDTRALSSPPTITIWSVASLRFLGRTPIAGFAKHKKKKTSPFASGQLVWPTAKLVPTQLANSKWNLPDVKGKRGGRRCGRSLLSAYAYTTQSAIGMQMMRNRDHRDELNSKENRCTFLFHCCQSAIGGSQSRPQIAAQSNSFHKIPS